MAEQAGVRKGWLIFWLVVFWPVGLYLLTKRLNTDKGALFGTGKSMITASYVLVGLTVLMVLAAFGAFGAKDDAGSGGASTGGYLGSAALLAVGAVVLNSYGRALTSRATRYKAYISLVINQRQTSIDAIATAISAPIDVVLKELQQMIHEDYFSSAHLDVSQRKIVVPDSAPSAAPGISSPADSRAVACGGCGANNRVTSGGTGECEYCGAPLK